MAKKIRFRLYAMEPTEENIACASREEYHRMLDSGEADICLHLPPSTSGNIPLNALPMKE